MADAITTTRWICDGPAGAKHVGITLPHDRRCPLCARHSRGTAYAMQKAPDTGTETDTRVVAEALLALITMLSGLSDCEVRQVGELLADMIMEREKAGLG